MGRTVLGIDVGGANLKAATAAGRALSQPFELWKHPLRLPDALAALFQRMPPADSLAVTMTGELCDCFETKREGVLAILDGVEAAAGSRVVRVWTTDGRLASISDVRNDPLSAAASNWLALATFAGRFAPTGAALMVDVGSTTADVIPLHDGVPVPLGRTDTERLRSRELVYTGARRTPLCALLGEEGMAEFFATTQDVYLRLSLIREEPEDRSTADGRPATLRHAHARLARMLGGDGDSISREETNALALRVSERQRVMLARAMREVSDRLPERPRTAILAGSGEFLGRAAWTDFASSNAAPIEVISLAERLGPEVSTAACAYALAVLAQERWPDGGA